MNIFQSYLRQTRKALTAVVVDTRTKFGRDYVKIVVKIIKSVHAYILYKMICVVDFPVIPTKKKKANYLFSSS